LRTQNLKRYRITFVISFYIFFIYLFYYGFSPSNAAIDYNNVNTYFNTIGDLESGIESALKHAVGDFILPSGIRVTLTIDTELQNVVNNIFNKYDLPVGAFIAIEPKSGKVIAMSGYSSGRGLSMKPNLLASFPAASLIKIITASAALEDLNFSPGSKISYRGALYKVSRLDLKTPESNRFPKMTLTEAIAKSANNVFGKLTANYIGRERFIKYLDKFCFYKSLPFDLTVEESYAQVPEKDLELARAGAGFGKILISPIHAAMMGASVANDGVMMRPYIIESIKDKKGNFLYSAQKEFFGKTVKPETARKLIRMMRKTPDFGTMRKAFSKRKWRKLIKKFDVAGKTGSITWGPPKLRYEWSLGIAPAIEPSICFISLTGNKDLWHIKSTYIVREALASFFNYDYKKRTKKNERKKSRRNKIKRRKRRN
jgi:cell division protein FtsI/penicillin-binding protein 2